jgi:hypothetical protein
MLTLPRIIISFCLACAIALTSAAQALAFGGFYVDRGDAKIFNKTSQVIIARNRDRTILTMSSDVQGAIDDFALVVPIPVAIKKEQVHIGKRSAIDKLDTFSKPRLVEYFDRDPCAPKTQEPNSTEPSPTPTPAVKQASANSGIAVEDKFNVNEYEIVILSAKESNNLENWLRQNNYSVPKGASELINSYIKQDFKFLVAKVNLKEFNKSGSRMLRPLQIAYSHPQFMLPIRLGTINGRGEQDLEIYILSRSSGVSITNYETQDIFTDIDVPVYIKNEFSGFYQALFQRSYEAAEKRVAFREYSITTNDCDPCLTAPPTKAELQEAGVFWLDDSNSIATRRNNNNNKVFITRLHVRYTRDRFPEDLMLEENSGEFQAIYKANHPFRGHLNCPAGQKYLLSLRARLEKEADDLANFTGWSRRDIDRKIDFPIDDNIRFWQIIWGK